MCQDVPLSVYSKTAYDIANVILLPAAGEQVTGSNMNDHYAAYEYFDKYGACHTARIFKERFLVDGKAAFDSAGQVVVRPLEDSRWCKFAKDQDPNDKAVADGVSLRISCFVSALRAFNIDLERELASTRSLHELCAFHYYDNGRLGEARFFLSESKALEEYLKTVYFGKRLSDCHERGSFQSVVGYRTMNPLASAALEVMRSGWKRVARECIESLYDEYKAALSVETEKATHIVEQFKAAAKEAASKYEWSEEAMDYELNAEAMKIRMIVRQRLLTVTAVQ
jgi:hypothetical protein